MSKKVFLSAGHGGSDPGAVANGLKEKDINLQTMLACQSELVRHGITVVCSRTTDENDPVAQEVKEANASGADIAVSFHANAGRGDGFEAFYYSGDADGRKLASLCEKYAKQLGQNSRGLKTNNLMFTRETAMTAVLVESFFLDHATDKQIGDTVAEQKAFGIAYAKAILEYLGITYKESVTSITAPIDKWYRVQIGAYKEKKNAEAMLKKVKAAGFTDAYINS
ncbi:MAG: N-acetylmuramoyl-L-alanine amidase [Tyzzerella sp.]|nr:N-acetylmuramoyl-L-alanine amidase [Tyzzerella sp.]